MEINTVSSRTHIESTLSEKVIRATKVISRTWQWRIYKLCLVLCDIAMVGFGFRVAYFARFELSLNVFQDVEPSFFFYRNFVFVVITLWLLIFASMGLYNRQNLLGGTQEYSLLFNATTAGMIIMMAAGFLYQDLIFARGWLILAWLFAFLFSAWGRFVMRRIVYALRRRGYFLSMAVIVGANNEGISLADQLSRWVTSGLHVVGFIDKKISPGRVVYRNLKVLGPADRLDEIVQEYHIEEIILASSAISSRDAMVNIFMDYGFDKGVNVRMSSGLYEILTTGLSVKEFAYVPLVGVNPVRLRGIDQFLKMLLDYSLTIPGIILIAPLLLAIAIAVKLDSPGPVIHRRRVLGLNGKQFDAFKFRTMYVNGDEILDSYPELKKELAENHKLKNDPRITRVGKFLRKTSLDELPQLFNVLKREMSLVGPRMITAEESNKYDKWDKNLLTVKPGITGLWQVSGRSDVSYEERVRLDMYYIRNWSIWLDLQLLMQTIPAVLKKRGAY